MTRQPLFDRIDDRIARDRDDSDYAYFHALTLKLEYLTKIVASGVIACVGDDADRHRYSLEYKLVRADSIGEWVKALNTVLVGAPAQFLISDKPRGDTRVLTRDLTERVGPGDWRYSAVTDLNRAAREVDAANELGGKVALRQFFDIGAQLRNRSRHGAPTASQCSRACFYLDTSLTQITQNLRIFRLPWAYLHRNLSGKYRVSSLLNDSSSFDYLKKTRDVRLSDGVFFSLYVPLHVPLIFSDPDLLDIALPNGNYDHKTSTFEVLSYVTNKTTRRDGAAWLDPPARLPQSETEGKNALEPHGNAFANLPPRSRGYVPRTDLEELLLKELLKTDRHPIISLTGPGGIGKTTIAIEAIEKIANQDPAPYEVILWISARDIDLLDSGPKPVSRRVFTQRDISRAVVELLEPSGRSLDNFKPDDFFQRCLEHGAAGTTLFVLDNFETVQNTGDVFRWIDTYIRPPNKVLITTRFRDFVGDYPIEITGMSDEEADKLVNQQAIRLNIEGLLGAAYKKVLIKESDGHPYVIKILLGQVAKERKAVKPQRIVATADHLLDALFKRTYVALSPAGQRVFLLLCSWSVFVPEVAVEAVSLRPGTKRFDVAEALEELLRFSLIDRNISDEDKEAKEAFVGVPLAAAMYGQRELKVSPLKIAVEEDRKLLIEFGAGKREDIRRGVFPRIDNFIKAVALRAKTSPTDLDEALSVLEYLAARVPKAYLRLAHLVLEVGDDKQSKEQAKMYLRSFLETAEIPERLEAWLNLADLCESSEDPVGEIHALCEAALLPTSDQEDLGRFANRLNSRIHYLKDRSIEDAWSGEVRELLARVIEKMERCLKELSATNLLSFGLAPPQC